MADEMYDIELLYPEAYLDPVTRNPLPRGKFLRQFMRASTNNIVVNTTQRMAVYPRFSLASNFTVGNIVHRAAIQFRFGVDSGFSANDHLLWRR